MQEQFVLEIAKQSIITMLYVSAPMLLLGLIVGLLVSIFQTTTSIQEQTLTYVPKILAIMGAIIVFGQFMLSSMMNFTIQIFSQLHNFVR